MFKEVFTVSKTLFDEFQRLIETTLWKVLEIFPTPFILYTEDGIREACKSLYGAFSGIPGYRNFYAVKANNNPTILDTVRSEGCGFDCSSTSELQLARISGAIGEDIFFSSNNTSRREFIMALECGSIFNFDDISLIQKMPVAPVIACARYNPGPLSRTDGQFIGKPEESKYGLDVFQIIDFFRVMRDKGVKRFMLHTMICSNEKNYANLVLTAKMMLGLAGWISRNLGIRFEAINMGGGFGIPYHPDDETLDISSLGSEIKNLFFEFEKKNRWIPKLFTENGRFIAGHSGVLVTTVINQKNTAYRNVIGVDAQTFSSVPRPFIYGAYHEITKYRENRQNGMCVYDIAGSLCENADKFATQRLMPTIDIDDILLVHNAGAHCYAMSGNYNGRTRPAEIMIFSDGTFGMIRRAQEDADLFREMIPVNEVNRIDME